MCEVGRRRGGAACGRSWRSGPRSRRFRAGLRSPCRGAAPERPPVPARQRCIPPPGVGAAPGNPRPARHGARSPGSSPWSPVPSPQTWGRRSRHPPTGAAGAGNGAAAGTGPAGPRPGPGGRRDARPRPAAAPSCRPRGGACGPWPSCRRRSPGFPPPPSSGPTGCREWPHWASPAVPHGAAPGAAGPCGCGSGVRSDSTCESSRRPSANRESHGAAFARHSRCAGHGEWHPPPPAGRRCGAAPASWEPTTKAAAGITGQGSDHWGRVDVAWETPAGYGRRSGGGTARSSASYSRPSLADPMPLFPTPS